MWLPLAAGWHQGRQCALVLCDDQQILGDALATALEAKGYDVLAVTTTAAAGVAAVAAHQPEVACLTSTFQMMRMVLMPPGKSACTIPRQGFFCSRDSATPNCWQRQLDSVSPGSSQKPRT